MVRVCCVKGCRSRNIKNSEEKIGFFRVPCILKNQCQKTLEISKERNRLWLIRLRLKPEEVKYHSRVCSKHFLAGNPSKLFDNTNPDWLPSLLLDPHEQRKSFTSSENYDRYQCRQKRSRNKTFLKNCDLSKTHDEHMCMDDNNYIQGHDSVSSEINCKLLKVENSTQFQNISHEEKTVFDTVSIGIDNSVSIGIDDSVSVGNGKFLKVEHSTPFQNISLEGCSTVLDAAANVNGIPKPVCHCSLQPAPSRHQSTQTEDKSISTDIETQTFYIHEGKSTQTFSNGKMNNATQTMNNVSVKCTQTLFRVCEKFELEVMELKQITLQTEIKTLDAKLKEAMESIKKMNKQVQSHVTNIEELKKHLEKSKFNKSFFDNNDKVKYFSGLETYQLLEKICEIVTPFLYEHSKLNPFQQLILTLMKLRLAATNRDLSYRFDISERTVGRLFYNCLNALHQCLYKCILWPEREALQTTMPMSFRESFGIKVAVIIDCFEVFVDKPSVLARAETGSNCKHMNTVKYLIGITPQGTVSFISKGSGGRVSDKQLIENSGLLEKLLPGDMVLANRGFDIEDSVGLYCASIKIPAFTNGKKQLEPEYVESSRKLANVRTHVERVIGSLRQKFPILHTKIPLELLQVAPDVHLAVIDKIAVVACALINLSSSVVAIE